MENAGKLDGNIAPPNDQHPFWQLIEEEHLVGTDNVLIAREVRHVRPPSCCNQNTLGTVTPTIYLYVMRVDESCPSFNQLHASG